MAEPKPGVQIKSWQESKAGTKWEGNRSAAWHKKEDKKKEWAENPLPPCP